MLTPFQAYLTYVSTCLLAYYVVLTYQAYLTDCVPRLGLDLERSRREGWQFGAKLVRGAYMEHERARAAALGYEDPTRPTQPKPFSPPALARAPALTLEP